MSIRSALTVSCLLAMSSAIAEQPTLCKRNEFVFFSCKAKDSQKVISVCGSGPLGLSTANPLTLDDWIQYRFGTPQQLEMVYPTSKVGSLDKFAYLFQNPNQNYFEELSFRNGAYIYTVFMNMPQEGGASYGVRVKRIRDPLKSATILCSGRPSGSINFLSSILPETLPEGVQ